MHHTRMGIVKITIFVAPSLLKRDLWQTVSFIGSLLVGFVMCYLNIQILQSLRIETHPRVWTDRKCLGENPGNEALFSCICYPGSKTVLYLWLVDVRWHYFFLNLVNSLYFNSSFEKLFKLWSKTICIFSFNPRFEVLKPYTLWCRPCWSMFFLFNNSLRLDFDEHPMCLTQRFSEMKCLRTTPLWLFDSWRFTCLFHHVV